MNKLKYGIIKEFEDGIILWFEPITDTIDGFVLRKPDQSIIGIWREVKK